MKRKREVDDTTSSPRVVVNIPQDVVVEEILEKLPIKSLLRFRAVSKRWRTEIESRRFQKRQLSHQQKSRDPSILVNDGLLDDGRKAFLRTLSLGETSVSLDEKQTPFPYPVHSKKAVFVHVTSSCDGLVCLYSKAFVCVINPATRWYRKLPEARYQALVRDTINPSCPSMGFDRYVAIVREKLNPSCPSMGFGKDNITGIYKIVWLYNSHALNIDGQTNTCEVFSFDRNNPTWRHDVILSSPHPILDHKVPAQAYGSLHWFMDAVTETQVLSFDLHTESFTVMTKIPVAYAPHQRITMCTLNNRLSLSEDKGDTQTIWSLNQDNVTWDKTYSIDLRSNLDCIEDEYLISKPPVASLSDDRLLLYDSSDDECKLVLFNSRLKSYGKFFTAPYSLGGAVSYYPSLLTLP